MSFTILSCLWTCLFYSIVCCLCTYLRILNQPKLPLGVSVRLCCLDVSFLLQPVLPLDSSSYAASPWKSSTACAAFGRAGPTAAYAASGRVCPTAAFAASGLTRTCSKADFPACLCLLYSLCCLWTRLFYNSLCSIWTCVSSMAACAPLEHVSSTVARPFPARVCVSVLQQSVLSPKVSGLQLQSCASNTRICSTAAIWRVCLL